MINWVPHKSSLTKSIFLPLLIISGVSLFRVLFFQGLGRGLPYLLYLPAILLAALSAGGVWAGVLATGLSACLCYFWIQEGYMSSVEWLGMGIFVVSGLLLSWVGQICRDSVSKALELQLVAEQNNANLQREIQERLLAQKDLIESEARLERAVLLSPFPIMIHAEDGSVLQLSNSWCEITGYSREEIPTTAEWVRLAYGAEMSPIKSDIDRLYGMEDRKYEGDFRVRTKNGGEVIWEFISSSLGPLPDGRRTVISMAMDVTVRRDAEKQVVELNSELERRVEARTAQLEDANKELEAFSYSVSHDLRAPLRAIDSFSMMVMEDAGPNLSAEDKRHLGIVRSETQRMGKLIDDLLHFSRAGRLSLNVSDIDMERLVKKVAEELLCEEPDRIKRLTIHPLPDVRGDESMIKQVWVNLLSNAFKFSGKVENPKIEIFGEKKEDGVTFWVRDNGAGFDPRYMNKLFGVFQRLHTEDEFKGTGVGLALVQRIIHKHGGKVWAESEFHQGATFYFSIPDQLPVVA